ncbi:MAG: glycosyltransferase family 4 protein [Bacteroidales bacterium]|nr:glycosyltransferase family 4 protein [Candidatus Sodaliphilus aphodohippi]
MINVFHVVSGKTWGGAEQYTYDLVSRLRHDKNFYVEVVCKKSKGVLAEFHKLEVPISILPLKGMTDIDSPSRFARLLRKGHNIVHVHTFHDAFMAVWARHISENPNTRVILTIHGIYHPRSNYLYRKIYRLIDHLVFTSQLSQDEFIADAKRLDVTKSSVIRDSVLPNPLLENVPVTDMRKQFDVKPDQVLIMYHGRLCEEKGITTLLHAATRLDRDKYKMVLMGEGSAKFLVKVKGFIVANQLVRNITLAGFQTNITKLISQCDIGVLPSITPEALGLANLEYMMQGKAHVSTNNGAQREYITNGINGILVPPGDEEALAQAISTLINDTQLRATLGANAGATFEDNLNYDKFYASITDLYTQLSAKN